MDSRDHFKAAEGLAAQADFQYARTVPSTTSAEDCAEALQRAATLSQMSSARALLAWASALGADSDVIDLYDPATKAPVVQLATRNGSAAAAPPATATTPTDQEREGS